jgi:hypothetical protein
MPNRQEVLPFSISRPDQALGAVDLLEATGLLLIQPVVREAVRDRLEASFGFRHAKS